MRDSLNHRRTRWFKIGMIFLPILVLALFELALHLADYGGNRKLFKPSSSAPGYLQINGDVGSRYFPNLQVKPETANDIFLAEKPGNTYRLFVMGGSSAYGYPYGHNGSFSRMLDQRLKAIFPGKNIEIINLGMTAINSYSLLDLLPEVLEQEPDALVVYAGHNEYYGALGAASVESLGRSRTLIKLNLALQNLRSFLFLRDSMGRIAGSLRGTPEQSNPDATLMERMVAGKTIPMDSELYSAGVSQFSDNLNEMAEKARAAGVPVFFCTLTSNLRDQKPFVSAPLDKLDDNMSKKMDLARTLLTNRHEDAIPVYQELVAANANHAQLHYELGQSLLAQKRMEEATAAFLMAKDHDALRFRAPSVFNTIIREITSKNGHSLVDIESAFMAAAVEGPPGNELFLEHLHPRLEGYFIMARVIANVMQKSGQIAADWPELPTDLDAQLWDQVAMTPIDHAVARIRIDRLTRRWPFVAGNPPLEAAPKAQNSIEELAIDLWQEKLTWEQAHVKAAHYYTDRGDFRHSAKEYEALILETPRNVSPYLRAGLAYSQLLDFAPAKRHLNASLRIAETAQAHKILGAIYLKETNPETAIKHLDRANRLTPQDPQLLYNLAAGHLMLGEPDAAQNVLAQLEAVQPEMQSLAALKLGISQARARQQNTHSQ